MFLTNSNAYKYQVCAVGCPPPDTSNNKLSDDTILLGFTILLLTNWLHVIDVPGQLAIMCLYLSFFVASHNAGLLSVSVLSEHDICQPRVNHVSTVYIGICAHVFRIALCIYN